MIKATELLKMTRSHKEVRKQRLQFNLENLETELLDAASEGCREIEVNIEKEFETEVFKSLKKAGYECWSLPHEGNYRYVKLLVQWDVKD